MNRNTGTCSVIPVKEVLPEFFWLKDSGQARVTDCSFCCFVIDSLLSYINIDVDMDMDFTVEFYETKAGACPVLELLDELKTSDPDDFAAVFAGLAKLKNRQYHREPLAKALGDGLFELRHVGKLNTRVLWFFMRNRRIVAVHGIRNKGQAIPARDIETARERMIDWRKRVER
jgi:phage-related protein